MNIWWWWWIAIIFRYLPFVCMSTMAGSIMYSNQAIMTVIIVLLSKRYNNSIILYQYHWLFRSYLKSKINIHLNESSRAAISRTIDVVLLPLLQPAIHEMHNINAMHVTNIANTQQWFYLYIYYTEIFDWI
jgi:hypothetical protein